MRAKRAMVMLAIGSALLGGCYESPDVTLHKPGVYKGARDPLVLKEGTPEQQKTLLARFNQVQTDR